MSKRNNKGFTLVELIIAMSILSIVLTLGYNVITGTDRVTTHQMEVFSEQQGANLVNRYLTKDLEQVREFIPADTSLNPYTYVLKDDVDSTEQIEYEVKKTTDGKFYTLTRKTSSGSIELLSNYPTSSEIPFSITKINEKDNIFKVILNGKGKDFEVGKYEFEVVSRLDKIVVMGETVVPPQGGGDTVVPPVVPPQGGDDTVIPPDEGTTSPVKKVPNGEILFTFSEQVKNNKTDYYLSAKAKVSLDNPPIQHEDLNNKITEDDTYTIQATIPVQKSNRLGIQVSCLNKWKKDNNFQSNGKQWDRLINEFVNEGIDIYSGKGVDIIEVKIDGTQISNQDGKYYLSLLEINNKSEVNVEVNIKVNSYINEPYLTIGFGKYNEVSN